MESKPQYVIPDIEAKDGGYIVTLPKLPEDLSQLAIKAARRLQSLTEGKVYILALVKYPDEWLLSLVGSGKTERLK